jgi:hypothetical protein
VCARRNKPRVDTNPVKQTLFIDLRPAIADSEACVFRFAKAGAGSENDPASCAVCAICARPLKKGQNEVNCICA